MATSLGRINKRLGKLSKSLGIVSESGTTSINDDRLNDVYRRQIEETEYARRRQIEIQRQMQESQFLSSQMRVGGMANATLSGFNNQWMPTQSWDLNFPTPRANPIEEDSVKRLIHKEDGPAVYLADGRVLYYWHGVNVPGWIIMEPEKITIQKILRTRNIELRRVMIERFGQGKFLIELGAHEIHKDEFGILWESKREELLARKKDKLSDEEVTELFGENRKIKYVQVKDASTDREYFIPCPSTMKRAKAAIAWSFHLKEDEYNPEKQT